MTTSLQVFLWGAGWRVLAAECSCSQKSWPSPDSLQRPAQCWELPPLWTLHRESQMALV